MPRKTRAPLSVQPRLPHESVCGPTLLNWFWSEAKRAKLGLQMCRRGLCVVRRAEGWHNRLDLNTISTELCEHAPAKLGVFDEHWQTRESAGIVWPGIHPSTVSFHNFKSQNFKLSVSNPKITYVAYLSVLSQISNCQGLGRKHKHEILKTDRSITETASTKRRVMQWRSDQKWSVDRAPQSTLAQEACSPLCPLARRVSSSCVSKASPCNAWTQESTRSLRHQKIIQCLQCLKCKLTSRSKRTGPSVTRANRVLDRCGRVERGTRRNGERNLMRY